MKIAIDLIGAQTVSRLRGIGRYTRSFTRAFIEQTPETHEVELIATDVFPEAEVELSRLFSDYKNKFRIYRNLTGVAAWDNTTLERRNMAELVREAYLRQHNYDWVLTTSLFEGWGDDAVASVGRLPGGAQSATILYDLIPLQQPEKYLATELQRQWYDRQIDTLKKTDLLFSISDYSKNAALDLLGIAPDRLHTIYGDADDIFTVNAKAGHSRQKYGLTNKFILFAGIVAQEDPRKNVLWALENLISLDESTIDDWDFVVVGEYQPSAANLIYKILSEHGYSKNKVRFLGHVGDDELVDLYNICGLFVFPSLQEGFGLPVLEAMRCGAPVLASSATSIPEITGKNDIAVFDPTNSNEFKKKVALALGDESYRKRLKAISKKRQKLFSWEKTARIAWAALEESIRVKDVAPVQYLHQVPERFANLKLDDADTILTADVLRVNQIRTPHIFFDVTVFHKINSGSGIQRVVSNIVNHNHIYDTSGYATRFLYRDDEGDYRYANVNEHTDPHVGELADIRYGDKIIFIDLDLALINFPRAKDFIIDMHGIERIFVLYDLLPLQMPHLFNDHLQKRFVEWARFVSEHGDTIVAISDSVRQEMHAYLLKNRIENRLKLGFFHLGANIKVLSGELNENEINEIKQATETSDDIFISVSTVEPRKGYNCTLDAFDSLWTKDNGIRLIIVGKPGWKTDDLQKRIRNHAQFGKRLFWFEKASDLALLMLYEKSTCLISASEGEGFGLPLIEAAQHEIPLIVSDINVFKEIVGKNGLFFKQKNPDDLAKTILSFRKKFKKNTHPKSEKISYLTWEESAKALQKAVEGHGDIFIYDGLDTGSNTVS